MQENNVSILKKADRQEWDEFLTNCTKNHFFQSSKAYDLFKKIKGYQPVVLLFRLEQVITGSLLAVLIQEPGMKGYFSKRCIVWGGPIIDETVKDRIKIAKKLLKSLNKSHSAIYTEFRNFYNTGSIKEAFQQTGYTFNNHLNYIVKVGANEDESLQLLNASKRRQVRKSVKEGARIELAESIGQVREFYNILSELYKKKVKKPLPSFQFFESFFSQKAGVYLLIYRDDEMLGGIMCPVDKHTIYEWYVAGLDGKYKNIYPSVLATWAPIEYASKNGLKYFDFLGAGKPNEDYGVREFKSKFGGTLVEYGRYKKVNRPVLYKIGELGLRVLQKIR